MHVRDSARKDLLSERLAPTRRPRLRAVGRVWLDLLAGPGGRVGLGSDPAPKFRPHSARRGRCSINRHRVIGSCQP